MEHSLLRKNPVFLFEKYGVFKGNEEIANLICQKIREGFGEKGVVCIADEDSRFNKIFIIETDNVSFMAYDPSKSVWNNIGESFDEIHIYVNPSVEWYELKGGIMHELQHAYEDYVLRKQNDSLRLRNKRNGVEMNNILSLLSFDELNKMLHDVFYFLNKVELNAYVSQIHGQMQTIEGRFDTIDEIVKQIRKLKFYRNYLKIFQCVSIISNVDKSKQEQVLDYANMVTGGKFKTYNQFTKWLNLKTLRIKNKLENMVSKIALDVFNDQMTSVMPN